MPDRLSASSGALLGALALVSCSLYLPATSVPVSLPELPEHWRAAFQQIEYRLQWPSGEDGTDVAGGEWRGVACPQRELRLPKRAYLPVVARPYLPEVDLLLPCAGGVFPVDVDPGGCLHLSWRRGPAAELLLDLDGHGLDLEHLNVPRLCAELELAGGEDPWNLDLAGIAAGLASGEMRATAIRLQPLADLRLPAGPGHWFLESPLRLPCPADAEGLVSLPAVGPGLHLLFRAGGGERLDLYVGDQEVLWLRRQAALQRAVAAEIRDRSGGSGSAPRSRSR